MVDSETMEWPVPVDHPAAVLEERSVAVALGAVAAMGVVRVLEVLAGLHNRFGALPISTTLVVVLGVLLFRTGAVRTSNRKEPPHRQGHDNRHRYGNRHRHGIRDRNGHHRRAAVIGGLGVVGVLAAAHGLGIWWLRATGGTPTLVATAVNPATKSTAAVQVGAALVFGVALAAVGEELLFRGIVLESLNSTLTFWPANLLQATLFGIWHFAWPLAILLGDPTTDVALPIYAVGFVLVTGTVGAVFGVFARATGTLWTPVLAHLLHNLTAVLVHVRAADGSDRGAIVAPVLVVGYVTLAWLAWTRREPAP